MSYLLYQYVGPGLGAEATEPMLAGSCESYRLFSFGHNAALLRAAGIEYAKTLLLAVVAVLTGRAIRSEFRLWVYTNGGRQILHYSLVAPTSMHFPWMTGDMAGHEVGGCFTVATARGQRIYPYILSQIVAATGGHSPLYMIVAASNSASRAGMERAGFETISGLKRSRAGGVLPEYLRQEARRSGDKQKEATHR